MLHSKSRAAAHKPAAFREAMCAMPLVASIMLPGMATSSAAATRSDRGVTEVIVIAHRIQEISADKQIRTRLNSRTGHSSDSKKSTPPSLPIIIRIPPTVPMFRDQYHWEEGLSLKPGSPAPESGSEHPWFGKKSILEIVDILVHLPDATARMMTLIEYLYTKIGWQALAGIGLLSLVWRRGVALSLGILSSLVHRRKRSASLACSVAINGVACPGIARCALIAALLAGYATAAAPSVSQSSPPPSMPAVAPSPPKSEP
jgi:hypothetical protein